MIQNMGLFGKKAKSETKCDVCDLVLPSPERLERHKKKAHSNVPEKKWMILLVVIRAKAGCGSLFTVKKLVDDYGRDE